MKAKKKDIVLVIVIGLLLFGMSAWCWMKKPSDFSESERRVMASAPKVTVKNILSGKFMTDFESYTVDQFPMRDTFRGIKSASELFVLSKLDNNDLYIKDGYIAKKEYPYNEKMLDNAAEKFTYIYDNFIKDSNANVYLSVVPDKNCFLASDSVRLSLDYPAFIDKLCEKLGFMKYIDITDLLRIEDYYYTDTHWRQEAITDVAERIGSAMGADVSASYTENTVDEPFKGVYYGQLSLPVKKDTLRYLTSETLDNCKVVSYNTGKAAKASVYNLEKAKGRDPYEMFLEGADALLIIQNPNAKTKKELVVFRDSFGSSLTPLLVEGYSKITLVDIRYVQSSAVGSFVKFKDQDVLFLYSTLILNNSLAFK